MTTLKRCSRCRQSLPFDCYSRNALRIDGLNGYCRPCKKTSDAQSHARHKEARNAKAREWALANPEKRKEIASRHARAKYAPIKAATAERREQYRAERQSASAKACPGCERVLPVNEFWSSIGRLDGRQDLCCQCAAEQNRRYYRSDLERSRANGRVSAKRWREANPELARAVRDKAVSKMKAKGRLPYQTLTDGYIASTMDLSLAQVSPEIIAAQRARILIRRQLLKERDDD